MHGRATRSDYVSFRTDREGFRVHPCSGQMPETNYRGAFFIPTPPTHLEQLMNKDQIKGQVNQVHGKIKEATGKIVGDKTLENKGKIQNISGKIQENYGDLKEDIKDGS